MNDIKISTKKLEPTVKEMKKLLMASNHDVANTITVIAMLLIEVDAAIDEADSSRTLDLFSGIYNAVRKPGVPFHTNGAGE